MKTIKEIDKRIIEFENESISTVLDFIVAVAFVVSDDDWDEAIKLWKSSGDDNDSKGIN